MATSIMISEEKFNKVLTDVEVLIKDVTSLFKVGHLVKKRLAELKANPSLAKTEKELDDYLKRRGVNIA